MSIICKKKYLLPASELASSRNRQIIQREDDALMSLSKIQLDDESMNLQFLQDSGDDKYRLQGPLADAAPLPYIWYE